MKLSLLLALLIACQSSKPDDDDDGGTDGSADQEVCDTYIACATAVSPAEMADLLEAYGEDGTCWGGSADQAELCIEACEDGLAELRELSNELACWPSECAEFMVAWNECGGSTYDESLCGNDYGDWRECMLPGLETCDEGIEEECQDYLPSAEGAVYRSGAWSIDWSDVDDACDEIGFAKLRPDVGTITGDGVGDFVLEYDWLDLVELSCEVDGSDFVCLFDGTLAFTDLKIRHELQGSFGDTETAHGSLEYEYQLEGKPECTIGATVEMRYR